MSERVYCEFAEPIETNDEAEMEDDEHVMNADRARQLHYELGRMLDQIDVAAAARGEIEERR